MKKNKYIIISLIALSIIINSITVLAHNIDPHFFEKIQNYDEDTRRLLYNTYPLRKAGKEFYLCILSNPSNISTCDTLSTIYNQQLSDYKVPINNLSQTIRPNNNPIIQSNDLADLYRLDKYFHNKSDEELLKKQDKINQKLQNIKNNKALGLNLWCDTIECNAGFHYFLDAAQLYHIRLDAIKRELQDRNKSINTN